MIFSINSNISQETFFWLKTFVRIVKIAIEASWRRLEFFERLFQKIFLDLNTLTWDFWWKNFRNLRQNGILGIQTVFFEQLQFSGKKMYSFVWFRKPRKNCFDFWQKKFSSELPKAKVAFLLSSGIFWWKIFIFFRKYMIYSIIGNFLLNALFSGYNCPSGLSKCLQRVKIFFGFFGTFSDVCSWPLTTKFWDLW